MSLAPESPTAQSVLPHARAEVPPGWYPDPAGSFQQRWWSGSSWTNDFAQYRPGMNAAVAIAAPAAVPAATHPAATQPAAGPPVAAAPAALPATAALPVAALPVAALPATVPPSAPPAPAAAVAPPVVRPPVVRPTDPLPPELSSRPRPAPVTAPAAQPLAEPPRRRHTAAAWAIALLPVLPVAAAAALALYLPDIYGPIPQAAVVLVYLAGTVGFAIGDRSILVADGQRAVASPAYALVAPFHLAVRSALVRRETGRGAITPFLVSLLVLGGIAAALVTQQWLLELIVEPTYIFRGDRP